MTTVVKKPCYQLYLDLSPVGGAGRLRPPPLRRRIMQSSSPCPRLHVTLGNPTTLLLLAPAAIILQRCQYQRGRNCVHIVVTPLITVSDITFTTHFTTGTYDETVIAEKLESSSSSSSSPTLSPNRIVTVDLT